MQTSQVQISGGSRVSELSSIGRTTVGLRIMGPLSVFGQRRGSLCSGTVISADFVLTAAHCFAQPHSVSIQVFSASGVTLQALGVVKPQALGFSPSQDVALVAVPGIGRSYPFQVTPYAGGTAQEGATGTVIVAGYGQTRPDGNDQGVLRYTSMVAVNSYESGSTFDLTSSSQNSFSVARSACQGDSGGPVFVQKSGRAGGGFVVQGIISRGALDCSRMASVTATRVAAFAPWIQCVISAFPRSANLAQVASGCSRFL